MRKFWVALVIILLILALGAVAALWGWDYYQSTFVSVDGTRYRQDIKTLDLSGTRVQEVEKLTQMQQLQSLDLRDTGLTQAQYDTLCQALPECRILWSVPFRDGTVDCTAEKLSVEALTDGDLAVLEQLPGLKELTVTQPGSYGQLMLLAQTRPDINLTYSVQIGTAVFGGHRTLIRVMDTELEELAEKLPYLPYLETVVLAGELPASDKLSALREDYPELEFRWEVSVHGVTASSRDTRLDMSGVTMEDTVALEAAMEYLPNLDTVILCGCGLSNEQLLSLRARWENISVIWNVEIGEHSFRTDVTEIDISGTKLGSVTEIESLLPCFTNLEQVVMSFCGISNPDMDALNRRYDDIKFVWSVYLGNKAFRTDSTYYIPVKWGQKVEDVDVYNLRYCTDMLSVDLGHMEITNIDFVAFMPHLKYLIIADTLVTSLEPLRGLKELVYLEAFVAPVWDYSPLLTCTALEDLNICYTYGQVDIICQMTWLKRLWWGGGHMYHAQNLLQQSLPNTQIDIRILWSTGNGWRKAQNYYDMRDLMGMHYMEQD